ncbi:MAG: fatty acid desaturase [Bacteriovoracaceae bacterium]|nr:fatty acid desaturase [Bacteriovoracaceae bacterium]
MRYSLKDLGATLFIIIQFALTLFWALNAHSFSWPMHLVLIVLGGFIFYYNPIMVTHNFLHTPFFKSSLLNRLFELFNCINLGLPQILYKHHHLTHHRYNNSLEDPSSTKLKGKNGGHEHWIPYSALSLLRDGTQKAWAQAIAKGEGVDLALQVGMTVIGWGLWFWIDWKWTLYAWLPLFWWGWFLAHMENYFEHFNAKNPDSRFGNSVSYYGPIYNLIMMNEGYHQEHHISPQTHWTERPALQSKYEVQMRENQAYAAKNPPLLGFLD